jgi:hypothetical protein
MSKRSQVSKLFTFAAAASAMLAGVAVALWVASYFTGPYVRWTIPGAGTEETGHTIVLASHGHLEVRRLWFPSTFERPEAFKAGIDKSRRTYGGQRGPWRWLGFEYSREETSWGSRTLTVILAIPFWSLVGLTAVIPVWRFGRPGRRSRGWLRARRGLCPSCGYGLRASPGRCTECGAVPAAGKGAT